ncbi:MAG: hypothetical protein JWN29_991 [Acidimicrobiales bacterium]|nr:hypothetical protein [Acidimicrobiales bacterium]
MRRICVYCGSNPGNDERYAEATVALAGAIVAAGCGLVYGGAAVGLMGLVADSVLAAGGEVIGVIPRHLVAAEIAHGGLTELHEVDTMTERKTLMADLSDAFVALPGGYGTLDELFEVLTWSQLGIHAKPAGLLEVGSFWNGLTGFLDHAVAEGFIRPAHRTMLLVDDDPARLLTRLAAWHAPVVNKWVDREDR